MRAREPAGDEPRHPYSALDQDWDAEPGAPADAGRARPLAWWRSARGRAHVVRGPRGPAIETRRGDWLEQPVPIFAPFAAGLRVRGQVAGRGTLVLDLGHDQRVRIPIDGSKSSAFEIGREALPNDAPITHVVLRLEPATDGTACVWSDLEVVSELPCPTETALRAEVLGVVMRIFREWLALGLDDVGPRPTALFSKAFDAVTGETLFVARTTGFSSLYPALLDVLEVEETPALRAAFERSLEDFFALLLQPDTGLPRNYDPLADVPDDLTPIEIALPLGFLIDLAQRGPERFRARALSAARRIGDVVLARGQLPDGSCAASFVPRDGQPNTDVARLRRLDVPLQLVRLSKLAGNARYARAARDPLAALEFTNHWAGTWDSIDPGFDDDFGHYGARATRIVLEDPGQVLYRRFALEGWNHYAPLWRDALRFGGNVAADQVRCWKVAVDLCRVEPALRAEASPLLRLAARSHFKGEQYGNGAWGDVTLFDYRPNDTLQVGDLPGAPQNLLHGLALVYDAELGLRTDEIRAMYTAVLRSSIEHYERDHGFLVTRIEQKGPNPAFGSVRMLTGLVEMLRALSRGRR